MLLATKMRWEDALNFIDRCLEEIGKEELKPLDVELLKGIWLGHKYREIASNSGYEYSTISRDASGKFLRAMAELFNVPPPVKKNKLKSLIIREYEKRSSGDLPGQPAAVEIRRDQVLATVEAIQSSRYRLVFVYSPKATLKNTFTRQLEQILQESFTIQRLSLNDCSVPTDCLAQIISLFDEEPLPQSRWSFDELLQRVQQVFTRKPCLLVLKDGDATYEKGTLASQYAPEYKEYGIFLDRIVRDRTRSCIVWVSRNPPVRDGHFSGFRVAFQKLRGFSKQEIEVLYPDAKALRGTAQEWQAFLECFNGNPYLVEDAVQTVIHDYRCNLSQYLQSPFALSSQMRRYYRSCIEDWLSPIELTFLKWLAIRQPVISQDLVNSFPRQSHEYRIRDVLDSLIERSLCNEIEHNSYNLPKSLTAYVLETLLEQLLAELSNGAPQELHVIPLMQAKSSADLDKSQGCFFTQLIERLRAQWSTTESRINGLSQCLDDVRRQMSPVSQSYAASNLLSIAVALELELHNFNFSKTHLRELDFSHTELRGVNFSRCTFEQCSFAEPIDDGLVMAFSPDNAWLATGDSDGRILVWNLTETTLHRVYHNYDFRDRNRYGIWALGFQSSDILLVIGDDGHIRRWNILKDNWPNSFSIAYTDHVTSLFFSSDRSHIALVTEAGNIQVLELTIAIQHQFVFNPEHENEEITAVAFSPDNKSLVTCGQRDLHLWRLNEQSAQKVEMEPCYVSGGITSVIFQQGAGGNLDLFLTENRSSTIQVHHYLVASEDYSLRRINSLLYALPEDMEATVVNCSFDLQYLVSINSARINSSRIVQRWHRPLHEASAEEPFSLNVDTAETDQRWALAHDGQMLAVSSLGRLQIWHLERQTCHVMQGYWHRVTYFAATAQASRVVTGHEDGTIRLWNGENGRYVRRWGRYGSTIHRLTFSPCGSKLAIVYESREWSKQLCIFNIQTEQPELEQFLSQDMRSLQFSSDGKYLAGVGSSDYEIRIWQFDERGNEYFPERSIPTDAAHTITCLSFIPNKDRRWLIYGGAYGSLFLRNIETGREERLSDDILERIEQLKVSPDGESVLVRTRSRVYLLDLIEQSIQPVSLPTDAHILAVSFDLSDQVLIAHSVDPNQRSVTLLFGSIDEMKQQQGNIAKERPFPRAIKAAAFTPDGHSLIGYQPSKRLFVWQWRGDTIKYINAYYPYTGLNLSQCSDSMPYYKQLREEITPWV